MSNGCALTALTIKKRMKQRFNYTTAKLIKYNINNKYSPSFVIKRAPECKRTEKNKRKVKQ